VNRAIVRSTDRAKWECSLPAGSDLSVAATALKRGVGVLVGPRDEAHFRQVPDLWVVVLSSQP